MKKKLKYWTMKRIYSGYYHGATVNVAAYSQKQAVDIINKYLPDAFATVPDLRTYYLPSWGIPMDDVQVTDPSLYVTHNNNRNKLL